MEESILLSIKKMVHIGVDDTSFDFDILIYINSAFSTLTDLGVGPEEGFVIEDDSSEWSDFLSDPEDLPTLSKVKTFVGLQTRILFDPPGTSFLLDSMTSQIEQSLWRISVRREADDWADPNPPVVVMDGE